MTLRDHVAALEAHGLLERQGREVSWRHEIGRLTRESRKALLFERIEGYPGWRLLTNGMRTHAHVAVALGLDPGVPRRRIVGVLRERLASPIAPVIIDRTGGGETVVTRGIDLQALPVPVWSAIDAARYVGTWHLNITRDHETGARNVGVYRMQVLGGDLTTLSVSPRSHLAQHMNKAEAAGRDLEMAVPIGVGELLVMTGGAAPPAGTDELALAGALQGAPVRLVRCRSVALEVPEDSEIVLEGRIEAGVRVQDGPYLDYAGTASVNPAAYRFRVTALSYRSEPVFRGTSVGFAGGEDHVIFSLLARLGLVDFHGSRMRQAAQNLLLSTRRFRAFQLTGRVGALMRGGAD